MLTLDFLKTMLDQYGDQIAIEEDGIEVTYAELATAVNAMAVALQMQDPTFGSRVALCAGNSLEYLVSVMAIQAAGKVVVPLNCKGTTDQLHDILNSTLPTVVIVDDLGDALIRCDHDLKIHVKQFEGLVRTYRDHVPTRYHADASSDALQPSSTA